MNKAKVIVTVNKNNDSKDELLEFVRNGVNTFRLDLSEQTYTFCENVVKIINEINKEITTKVSIMLDTKGPRVSTGKFLGGKAEFKKNDKIRIYKDTTVGDRTKFSVDYKNLLDDVNYGSVIKLSNGLVELQVIDKEDDSLICKVINGGEVESNSFINIPDCKLNIDFMNKKNKEDIEFASKISADFLALSYISGIDDVLDVNDMLIESGNDHTAIISKIENEKALEELDEILKISEGLIVARTDLGAEIPIERIPGIQKRIINKCHLAGKISIVSMDMFNNDIDAPTRAEVSDIANSILDGVDAVLLDSDPVYNENTISRLQAINKIIETAEKDINYMDFYDKSTRSEEHDVTGNVISSVSYMSNKLKPVAIVVPTNTGIVAKKLSRFRPNCPILALTYDEEVAKTLNLHFGIYPIMVKKSESIDNIIKNSKEIVKKHINTNRLDKIIITGGYPIDNSKYTNLIEIEEI